MSRIRISEKIGTCLLPYLQSGYTIPNCSVIPYKSIIFSELVLKNSEHSLLNCCLSIDKSESFFHPPICKTVDFEIFENKFLKILLFLFSDKILWINHVNPKIYVVELFVFSNWEIIFESNFKFSFKMQVNFFAKINIPLIAVPREDKFWLFASKVFSLSIIIKFNFSLPIKSVIIEFNEIICLFAVILSKWIVLGILVVVPLDLIILIISDFGTDNKVIFLKISIGKNGILEISVMLSGSKFFFLQ